MGKQAFDGKRSQLFWLDPDKIVVIGLDTDDGPEHPLYDERAKLPVDLKLVSNIEYLGKVLEPISVRKNGETAETVYGRQRVKAARVANKNLRARGCEPVLVPCQLDRADDGRFIGMMISENEHRQGDTPMTKARKLARFMDHGNTEEDAAAMMGGVTTQTVRNYLALLDLDSSVQKSVESGKLAASAASKLAALPRDKQKAEAVKLIAAGGNKTAAAARAVKAHKNGSNGSNGSGGTGAPGKRVIKKVIAIHQEFLSDGEEGLPEDFIRGLRWALGELGEGSVKGLTAMVAEAQGGPKAS